MEQKMIGSIGEGKVDEGPWREITLKAFEKDIWKPSTVRRF